jgi:peptide/nickel transport system permease protein
MPVQPPETAGPEPGNLGDRDALMGVSSLAAEADYIAEGAGAIVGAELAAEGASSAADGVARRRLGTGFLIAASLIGLLALAAIFADFLPLASPTEQPRGSAARLEQSLPPFSTRVDGSFTVLGTDSLGRDQLSRAVYGARVALGVGFASIAIGTLIGGSIGLAAGYFRRGIDSTTMAAMDILLAFPALLLALVIVAIRGKGPVNSTIALGIVAIPTIARLVRANTLVFAQREFVLAARTLGASHLRVITKELLPNVFLALLPFIPLAIAVAIAAEGALAYLGQSVNPPLPSLGGMIQEGQPQLEQGRWWVPAVPIAFLVTVLVSLNLIGDRLREYFSIKESAL